MHLQRVFLNDRIGPHRVEQVGLADHVARLVEEIGENVEGGDREIERPCGADKLPLAALQQIGSELQIHVVEQLPPSKKARTDTQVIPAGDHQHFFRKLNAAPKDRERSRCHPRDHHEEDDMTDITTIPALSAPLPRPPLFRFRLPRFGFLAELGSAFVTIGEAFQLAYVAPYAGERAA